jgi:glycosyltransferase involved in cell wall biosynthesis
MRILHAARNIANQPADIVRALRALGHEAEVWEYDANPFGFEVDRTIPLDREAQDPAVFWQTFQEAIERFDILHFHFARSLFPNQWGGLPPFWDLPIYRILGKRVFATWHGSDCRLMGIHLERNPWSYFRFSDIRPDDDRTAKVLEVFRTYADGQFVTAPDYLDYVPDAEVLGRLIDLAEWPEQAPTQRDVPVVLHVPSRRGTKGTEMLLPIVERLKADGLDFDFRLLEGVPHSEARRAIAEADVVVDNLISGDYELVSIEAMAVSRVAVANVAAPSAAAFPGAPVWSLDPDTAADRLRTIIGDVALRRDLAARGREHVARHHDAAVGVERLVAAYRRSRRPVDRQAFPDWLSLAPARRVEELDRAIARARRRELDYRRRLGLPVELPDDRSLKDRLPMPLRLALRRWRARLTRAVRRR